MLEDTDQRWHALASDKMQGAVANLIYRFSMFEGILFETTDLGISAAHHSDDQVGNLADIKN